MCSLTALNANAYLNVIFFPLSFSRVVICLIDVTLFKSNQPKIPESIARYPSIRVGRTTISFCFYVYLAIFICLFDI